MSDDLKELTAYQATISDGQSIFPVAAIEYENKLWLVPQWLENTDEGWITPARIICMEGLQSQDLRGNHRNPYDFAVNVPIPKSVLEGRAQGAEAEKYKVIERPPIRFRKPAEPTRH